MEKRKRKKKGKKNLPKKIKEKYTNIGSFQNSRVKLKILFFFLHLYIYYAQQVWPIMT